MITPTFQGPFSIDTAGTTCGQTLAAGAQCDLTLRFQPPGSGMFTGSLSLAYRDSLGTLPPLMRTLEGFGQ